MTEGFIMAMRGELRLEQPSRRRRIAPVWFLVSRSGPGGRLLLVGCIGRGDSVDAATMVPRVTFAGRLLGCCGTHRRSRFALLDAPPDGVFIAGRLRPASGLAVFSCTSSHCALRIAARLPNGLRCRITLTRHPWFGEVLAGARPDR